MMLERIKAFCEKQGVTIEQFEKVIDVSPGYVYKLGKGHKPGMKILRKIVVLLETTVEEFADE